VNFARRDSCFKCRAPRLDARAAAVSIPKAPVFGEQDVVPAEAPARAPTRGHEGDGYEVFVKYLPHETTEEEVGAFFQRFGDLLGDARLIRDQNGKCKGAGFVSFRAEASRNEALRNDGARFGGRHLSVTVAKTGTFGVRATEQKTGTHTPAMLRETIEKLVEPDPQGVYVDGTFGRGGHSRGILNALGLNGRLHAFDMDPEVSATRPRGIFFFRFGRFVFFLSFPSRRAARRTRSFAAVRDENTHEPRKLFRMVHSRVATNVSPIEIERSGEGWRTPNTAGSEG
jgi:16S rRNA (cytosine1402-N4)-methyltransferase